MGTRVILAFALAVCGCSPYGGGAFACTEDSQCSPNGTCSQGFCAFPDPDCASGFRYGDLSGPSSGSCTAAQMVDASIDTPPGTHCYGTGIVMACFADVPTGDVTFPASTIIDTDDTTMCAQTTNAAASAWCVIAAQSLTVGNNFVAAHGSRPLVLVATQTIAVNSLLSVASLRAFNAIGPGSDMPGCDAGTAPTGTSGGAGGSLGGAGGGGAAIGGTGGAAGATLGATMLRGGCSGQKGADDMAMGGGGGPGGGAVYLIADTSITIGGTINASGEGGAPGAANAAAGAGGGGSGGMIGLDSPTLMLTGSIFANGGGGGEASGNLSGGVAGGDSADATSAGAGGAGGSNFGSDGGAGSVGARLTGDPGSTTCITPCTTPPAGGGGGGGAGIIKVFRATKPTGANISPPAT